MDTNKNTLQFFWEINPKEHLNAPMIMTPLANRFKFDDLEKPHIDLMNAVIGGSIDKINQSLKENIIWALKDKGFIFSSEDEMIDFAKNRCTIITHEGSEVRNLFVDYGSENEKLICSWDTAANITMEVNSVRVDIFFKNG